MTARRTILVLGAAGTLALLLITALARGDSAAAPRGLFIYEHLTRSGRWLESRDLLGGSRVALTPPVAPGELRRDCCAVWLSGGAKILFERRTPKVHGLYIVDADGTHLHQLVSESQLPHRSASKPVSFGRVRSSPDGTKFMFAVDDVHDCNSIGIFRLNADGSDLRPLYRRPARLLAELFGLAWSPDGKTALFELSHNDGDCYGTHIGASELKIATDDGTNNTTTLLKTDNTGGGSWLPNGSGISFADCGLDQPCNFWFVPADRSSPPRQITHFETFASPYGGFDEMPFLLSGQGNELIVARARSLFSLDPISGQIRRLLTAPCPRPSGRCPLPELQLYGISPARVAVIDVEDIGCSLCYASSPGPISKRYAVSLSDGQLTQLPDPGLAVDDLYLP